MLTPPLLYDGPDDASLTVTLAHGAGAAMDSPFMNAFAERLGHMATLTTPSLIVQGTRDALGAQGEVDDYPLSPAAQIHWSEDGDHSLKPRVASGRTEAQNIAEGVDAVIGFLRQL